MDAKVLSFTVRDDGSLVGNTVELEAKLALVVSHNLLIAATSLQSQALTALGASAPSHYGTEASAPPTALPGETV